MSHFFQTKPHQVRVPLYADGGVFQEKLILNEPQPSLCLPLPVTDSQLDFIGNVTRRL